MQDKSRRIFLKQMGLLGASGLLSYGNGLAFAQSLCATQRKTLVVIYLSGGVHSLSVLPPRLVQAYHDQHPNVGIQNPLHLTPAIGLHPAMSNLHSMFNGTFPGIGATFFNQVGFMNLLGQDVNSRSHDVATKQYSAAYVDPFTNNSSGWLGRYAALHCTGDAAAFSLCTLGGDPFMLKANGVYPISATNLADMAYTNDGSNAGGIPGSSSLLANTHVRDSIHHINSSTAQPANEHQQLYRLTHEKADSAVELLAQVRTAYTDPPPGTYVAGNPLNQRFMDTAALINSWNLTKATVIALNQGGYDTHSGQGNDVLVNGSYVGLANNLFRLDQALGSFYNDLSNRGIQQDVVTCFASEFGRTHQNLNVNEQGMFVPGTDHGTGGFTAVIGADIRNVIGYGEYFEAQFTNPNIRWLPSKIDIRSIYAEILERHLGVASQPIFPEPYIRTALNIFT